MSTPAPAPAPESAEDPRRGVAVLTRWLWPLAVANLIVNIGIVVTGAAVRLTGSGLGCPTWPRCTEESYRAHGELGVHGAIEFGNRLLTFVLVAVAVACWAAALARLVVSWRGEREWRPFGLATLIALGIPLQAIIGGVTVLTDLNPWVVGLHFMASMLIVMLCVALMDDLRSPDRGRAKASVRALAWSTMAAGWVVLYLGTIVTGAGPHAGDEDAPRNGLDPATISQTHAASVYLLVALTVAVLVAAIRARDRWLTRVSALVLAIEVGQGVLGWVQYLLDLPVSLVALHMLGAALLAAGLARLVLACAPRRAPAG